jgi:hypothetical protein
MKSLLCFLVIFGLFIQEKVAGQTNGIINLKVSDSAKKPLENIMVQLVKEKDSSMVQYAFTGQYGSAEFTGVKFDSYRIYISQVGYYNYFTSSFKIDSTHNRIFLPGVILQSQSLEEVVVSAKKTPPIEKFADRTVIHVDQTILSNGSNAMEILQRTPGVKVDQEDNISMLGKQNVMVMIDGRLTAMTGADLGNLLRALPSDVIDKIELITNPSAKYDANGTAGIINIVLKKNKYVGNNGTVSATYGQGVYSKTNESLSFNHRNKHINIFMNYNYNYDKNLHEAPRTRYFYDGTNYEGGYSEDDYHTISRNTNTGRLGADFFASDKTTFGFVSDIMVKDYTIGGATTAHVFDSLNNPASSFITNTNVTSRTINYAENFNCIHKFDSAGRQIVFNLDYANYTSQVTQNFSTNYYDINNNLTSGPVLLYGNIPGQLNIYSFKADYSGHINSNSILEAGIKTSYVSTNNNLQFYDGANSSAPVDTNESNHFIYTENINAAYFNYGDNIGKCNFQVGLRGEQTVAGGDQVTTSQTFNHNYFQLFPSAFFNDTLSKNNILSISATRRIDRPQYQELNPFKNFVDPSTYSEGNPYLQPQYTYLFQVTETYKQNYSVTLNYTRTQNVVASVWMAEPGAPEPVVAETEQNLPYEDYAGVNATAVCQVASWWSSTDFGEVYYTHYNADYEGVALNTAQYSWDVNTDNNFTIDKKYSINLNGLYSSAGTEGYITYKQQWSVSAGVQKKVLKGKGTIKLNAKDIFWGLYSSGTANFSGYIENFTIKRDTRIVSCSFIYHFGSSSSSPSMRSKGGAEDEKKRAG